EIFRAVVGERDRPVQEVGELDVAVARAAAELACAPLQPGCVGEAACEVGAGAAPGGHPPGVDGEAAARGGGGVGVQFRLERVTLAELVEVDDPPRPRLQLE